MESIYYCLIANNTSYSTIVDVSLAEGNFHSVVQRLLPKVPKDNSSSYSYESEYIFHCHDSDGIIFMCMTSQQFSHHKAYALLFDLKSRFLQRFGTEGKFGIGESGKDFAEEINDRIVFYSSEHADSLSLSRANIDRTRDIMIKNLDLVLERGEKIEILLLKTIELNDTAVSLTEYTKRLKRRMCWKRFKITLILSVVLIVRTI